MLEEIRYRVLMAKLRREIARTVRANGNSVCGAPAQTVVKSTCKVCGSIV